MLYLLLLHYNSTVVRIQWLFISMYLVHNIDNTHRSIKMRDLFVIYAIRIACTKIDDDKVSSQVSVLSVTVMGCVTQAPGQIGTNRCEKNIENVQLVERRVLGQRYPGTR